MLSNCALANNIVGTFQQPSFDIFEVKISGVVWLLKRPATVTVDFTVECPHCFSLDIRVSNIQAKPFAARTELLPLTRAQQYALRRIQRTPVSTLNDSFCR